MDSQGSIASNPARAAVAALAVVGLLMVTTAPGTAQTEAGAGTFALDETTFVPGATQVPAPFFCSEVDEAVYKTHTTLSMTLTQGTYTATGGTAVYAGALEIKMTATDNYYVTPEGTYHGTTSVSNPKAPCGPDNFGPLNPVPADFTILASNRVRKPNTTNAACRGTGHFWRVNTTFHAEWTLDADCKVTSNLVTGGFGIAPAGTLHTMEGNQQPCPCTGPAIVGTYQQTLH